jgi:undecaprenyl-diphosphatase
MAPMILEKTHPTLDRLAELDLELCRRCCAAQRRAGALAFFRVVSRAGDGALWLALAAGIALFAENAALAVLRMSAVGIAAALASRAVKGWVNRPRPYSTNPGILAGIAALDPWSFPSGHTLHAVAFNLVLVPTHAPLALALLPLTVAIAVSRVALGVHYPSDVAAGAAIGALLAGAVLAVS